ncbi:26S proteasome regulatory subunit, ATPase 3, interacting protein [Trypanosoma rangeli]|uniref:26S proteasome regulatory subunit, ATPase 3, interacting protein n=1 Tax=Trypanosoma rangeli TaxID=5698 RepID=A0A3R7MDB5_TRYRA|nr:26S proteasome regulatory subunit, ATPase 3, interacting protein [Trypanosoma rangeli]RNF03710.1 26S proteasome regulatory subunit, ATPase 3, interacting protein [Trypanosoma rangeli]|eukprot:RNF03710.1 26S proteasome regulatory subunit, ATPase 3, interacting protein [Trypanosoma rangeli]
MARKKASKSSDGNDAETAVLRWFECEGEPATVQSLTDALGSKFGKALVQSVLEQCVSEQRLQAKDIKKARFYFLLPPGAAENHGGDCLVDPARLELVQQLQQQTRSLSELTAGLNTLLQQASASERAANIALLSTECATLTQRLETVKRETIKRRDVADDEDILLLIRRYKRARELWRERKRMTEHIIDAILGDSCDSKELADQFGLISDQEAGVSLADTAIALPRVEDPAAV